jgi:CRISPR/Cas system CMR subunit Cmr6 (Cas7 group RAMP superfamily)
MATAKQRAWRKKFGQMARAGKFKKKKKATKKRTSTAKKTYKRRVSTVAKRRYTRRRSAFGSPKTLLKSLVMGAGVAGMLGTGIPGLAAGYLLGGPVGAGGVFLAPRIGGMISGFGGNTNTGGSW